jgi:hypothetical protein
VFSNKEMGQIAAILKACQCDSCAKYVMNDCACRSDCCEMCNLEIETHATELSREQDIEIHTDCFGLTRKSD